MERPERAALQILGIGVGIAVLGVAGPLAFDLPRLFWQVVFCGGLLITFGSAGFLGCEYRVITGRSRLVSIVAALAAVIAAGLYFWPMPQEPIPIPPPNEISFQKFALFYVETGEDTYQIGIVAKLFDESGRSFLAYILRFDRGSASIIGRGGWTIQNLGAFPVQVNLKIDNAVKANDITYLKTLLPVFFQMKTEYGVSKDIDPTPEFVLTGQWSLVLDKKTEKLFPLGYATSPRIVSQQQWNDLQKPKSKISMEDLDYKPFETAGSP